MAVTEVMQDPNAAPIPERDAKNHPLSRGLPCLICGEWIEADAKDAYRVLVSNPPREAEYASHEACLESVKHPSVPLPS